MSNEYFVAVPVDCCVVVTVNAESEEEAITKALESDMTVTVKGENAPELEQFELLRQVNKGNVCHITQWEAEVV